MKLNIKFLSLPRTETDTNLFFWPGKHPLDKEQMFVPEKKRGRKPNRPFGSLFIRPNKTYIFVTVALFCGPVPKK